MCKYTEYWEMNEIYDVIVLGTGLKVNFSRFAKYGEIWNTQ